MRYRVKIMCFLVCLIFLLTSVLLFVCLEKTSSILKEEFINQAELELSTVYSGFDKLTSTVLQNYVPLVYDHTMKANLQKEFTSANISAIRKNISIMPVIADYIKSIAVYSAQHNYIVSNTTSLTSNNLSSHAVNALNGLKQNDKSRVWFFSSEEFFKTGSNGDNVCLSFGIPIYKNEKSEQILTPSEDYLGYLFINLKLSYIEQLIYQSTAHENLDVFIFNKYGSILAGPEQPTGITEDEMNLDFLNRIENNGSGIVNLKSGKYLVCRKDGSYDNFFIYLSAMPYRQIEEKLYALSMPIITVSILIVILSLPISFLIFNSIYKPVGTMIHYMGKLANTRDFNIQITEKRSDEFGVMFHEFNQMTEKIRTLVQELYVNNLLLKDAELQALQSQINPHFLYNTLNTISCLSIQQKNEEVSGMIANLSDFMRLSLNDGNAYITVKKTIEQINSYLSIQRMRFPGQITFLCNVEEALLSFRLPTLLIQPLIENSVIHGIYEDHPITIRLDISRNAANQVTILQSDDGRGIPKEILENIQQSLDSDSAAEASFYALKNIHARIKLTYGEAYRLSIHSQPGKGTVCTILLPYDPSREEADPC